jgi:hypothetical protein
VVPGISSSIAVQRVKDFFDKEEFQRVLVIRDNFIIESCQLM